MNTALSPITLIELLVVPYNTTLMGVDIHTYKSTCGGNAAMVADHDESKSTGGLLQRIMMEPVQWMGACGSHDDVAVMMQRPDSNFCCKPAHTTSSLPSPLRASRESIHWLHFAFKSCS